MKTDRGDAVSNWIELFEAAPPRCRAYTRGGCLVFVGQEPVGPGGALRWHLSISRRDRYPSWDEISEARSALVPDAAMMVMVLPLRGQYVNIHPQCFHLHECPEAAETESHGA